MILAITGGTGFVGSHLIEYALAGDHEVRALTRRGGTDGDGLRWVPGALDDPASLAALFANADAVIHVAGVINAPTPAGFEAGNVAGTAAVLRAAETAGVGRFVHVSSLAAREPRLSAYGASKARSEAVMSAAPLDWTIVRPPAIYGPRDRELFELFRMAKRGVVPLPPGGRLSVIEVGDLCRLLLALAATPDSRGATYEPDDGVHGGWSHREFALALGDAVGRKVWPFAVPRAALHAASLVDGLVRRGRAKLTRDRVRYFSHPDWVSAHASRPPAALWRPRVATPDGLAATAAWYRTEGWL